jgi:hypothetical protein
MARTLPKKGCNRLLNKQVIGEKIMIWMEFIKVQTAQANVAAVLRKFVQECKRCKGLLDAKVFTHAVVEDCSLCLLWKTSRIERQGSRIGLHLADNLKKYGLVDHSVWVGKDENGEKGS